MSVKTTPLRVIIIKIKVNLNLNCNGKSIIII